MGPTDYGLHPTIVLKTAVLLDGLLFCSTTVVFYSICMSHVTPSDLFGFSLYVTWILKILAPKKQFRKCPVGVDSCHIW